MLQQNFLGRTETTTHEFVKPWISEQKIGHIPKTSSNTIIRKKDKDKRLNSNWRPILLLNVDYRIISNIFASRLKKVLLNLISSQQTAYVALKYIYESGRLISDLLSVTKK